MQKNRIRKIANFFAFNILFFSLYLNFIGKDTSMAPSADQQHTTAFGTPALNSQLEKTTLNRVASIR